MRRFSKKMHDKPIYKLTLKHKQRQYKSAISTPPKIISRRVHTCKSERWIIHKYPGAISAISSKPQSKQGLGDGEGRSVNIITSNIPVFTTKHRKQSSKFETLKEANDIVRQIRQLQGRNMKNECRSNPIANKKPDTAETIDKDSSVQSPKKMNGLMHSISSPLNLFDSSSSAQAMKIAVQKFMNNELK